MSISSDPERGGQQPDDRSPGGQPDGGAAAPQPDAPDPAAQGGSGAPGPEAQPGQYPPGQYQGGQYQGGQYPPAQQEPGQYPQAGPYGQPAQYGQPGQYPSPSYGQPYGDRGGYTYTPYGTYPAGMPEEQQQPPPSRPGVMILALVLLIFSTLPFLLIGLVPLVLPSDLSQLPPDVAAQVEQQLAGSGLSYEQAITGFGALAVFFVVVAVLYITFAVLAFLGRGWARIVLTIMTAGFALLALLGIVQSLDPAGSVMLLLIGGAAVLGTVLLWGPAASRYIKAPRR